MRRGTVAHGMAGRKGAVGGAVGPGVGIERAVALARRVGTALLVVAVPVAVGATLALVVAAASPAGGVEAAVQAIGTPLAASGTPGSVLRIATLVAATGGWLLGAALVLEGLAER